MREVAIHVLCSFHHSELKCGMFRKCVSDFSDLEIKIPRLRQLRERRVYWSLWLQGDESFMERGDSSRHGCRSRKLRACILNLKSKAENMKCK